METRTISKRALNKTRLRHNLALQWCMNYEKMQGSGFAFGMVPVIKDLYGTEEEQCQHLLRHAQFYNCHPAGSAAICGIACWRYNSRSFGQTTSQFDWSRNGC